MPAVTTSLNSSMANASAGRFIREHDWSASTLGPKEHWPPALPASLNLILCSPQPMLLFWGAQHLLLANDAGCALLGLTAQQALGHPAAALPQLPWGNLEPLIAQSLTGQASRCELLQIHSPVPGCWSLSCSPIADDDGQVLGAFCVVHDVTAQRQAQTRLQEELAFSQRVLASLNDCIKLMDLDGRLSYMNEGGQRLMEVSDFNAIRGCPWPDFWEGQGQADVHRAISTARNGQSSSFSGLARTMGGSEKWWHVQVSPVFGRDGKPEKILSVSRDMTPLYEAEEALRTLNESLEQQVQERTREHDRIWRLSTDLMLVARFDGTIHALNPAWNTALNWSPEQLLGSDFMTLVHPEDQPGTREAMAQLMSGQSISDFKNRYRRADGAYRTIAWTAVPDQQFIHAVGRDIQNQEEAGEALRISEEALRQAQKLEAIGQLTGGVAHDFNNLLTIIKSCTDLLKSSQLSPAKRVKYVQAISSTVDRAARLTGQLLAFARRQALQPEVFDINECVSRIGEMMDTLTGSRIQVSIELPAEPCYIYADQSQFDTALVNMVVNARDAMAGVGQLTIQVERLHARTDSPLPDLAEGDYVTITLTDTGAGIAADQLSLIFEPFYTTKAAGQGTGLGLSQVFGFAKQSGGEVVVDSELGHGSRFTLYLPSARQAPQPRPRQPATVTAGESGLQVLMVEDNPEIGTYTSAMLEQSGFKVLWVPGAREALQELKNRPEHFHVVFSDIAMPGMSGLELCAQIHRQWPDLPVILTTGYSTEFVDVSHEQAERFDLLPKPYRVEELSARLHSCVQRHRR
ncbi:multi-sensor hybrid histidine kinase [Pseudomonas sp. StFLB209]|nr:multi-sensor hybrid histidine kinase [Pseudomonas sp. StFLB209]